MRLLDLAKPEQKQNPSGSPAAQPAAQASPTVSGFRVQAKRTKSAKELSNRFAEISFLEMMIEGETLSVLNVESRDLRKEPALFSIIRFKPDVIECAYTCLANMSPKKRQLEVLRHFLNMLTLAEDCYDVQMKQIYQLVESSFAEMTEYVSTDYDKLYSLYDNLKTELNSAQKKLKELGEANSVLSKENYELKSRNDELTLRLRSLETLSDSVLQLKIQEWLSEHNGEINISDFSKVYNVPEMRVEQMLNKMVTEGYLETKG
ncbi:MAG: hypothetical protein N3F07_00145 [Candidatus Micrarchaeota archaeon]|nr:hypothetical protein [Candidatus Micrarchaeota archaeon]